MDESRTEMHCPAMELSGVTMVYGQGVSSVTALDRVSLTVPAGSFTAVMGPSGSGKSTFLQCAAGLEQPTSGTVTVGGTSLLGLNDERLTRFRRSNVGFVFQNFHLMSYLTAEQNIELPLRVGRGRVDAELVDEVLTAVGLLDRRDRYPAQLSGGQQQRVAVARALVTRPAIIFADEPTGALDSVSAREVLTLLQRAARERDQTIVMVTHDPIAAAYADVVVFLVDGAVHGQMQRPSPEAVTAQMIQLGYLQESAWSGSGPELSAGSALDGSGGPGRGLSADH